MPSTTDYDRFKFRPDNRKQISQAHVDSLTRSLDQKNLLPIRPIIVNEEMEIIDGQHRFLAAKKLGLPISYEVMKDFDEADIIKMNFSKSWNNEDYLNFYCKQGKPEYLKLRAFIRKYNISVIVATTILGGKQKVSFSSFKKGEFVFNEEELVEIVEECRKTIEVLREVKDDIAFLKSLKFYSALFFFIKSMGVDKLTGWLERVQLLSSRITAKPSKDEYLESFKYVFNYNRKKK